MLLDASLAFVPPGYPLSCVSGTTGASFGSGVIDLLGVGVGQAPPDIIGNASTFGMDVGVGGGNRPELAITVGTAFVTGNSASLNVQFQEAADTGSGGGYQPGTWNTIIESGYLAASVLTANTPIFRVPIPPVTPKTLRPRFLRLNFQVLAGTTFTAGTIAFAAPTWSRDDWSAGQAAKNYSVG